MGDEALVSPADIARLAAVGRSAVSNWRRRYPDFPRPAAGTPAAPLYALGEIEAWLRDQGKLEQVPLTERAWQELRAQAVDDLRLPAALADAGETMLDGTARGSLGELVAARGAGDAFEVLASRLHEAQGRGAAPASEVAELAAALAGAALAGAALAGAAPAAGAVLDPACGAGELLLAARDRGAHKLRGQDADADVARLAAVRLKLTGHGQAAANTIICPGDALLGDAFPGLLADAVLCAPPPHWRAGELDASDPRWVYGVPPRLEPELAWVQHMLAHLAPAGLAVAIIPAAAAGRRPGRRIRAELLRKGALRAVLAPSHTLHLWLLRTPAARTASTVLLAASAEPQALLSAWQRFGAEPDLDDPGVSRGVPVIDLLDDEVDLTPGRHLSAPPPRDIADRFTTGREHLGDLVGGLGGMLPDVTPSERPAEPRSVTIAELTRLGHVTVQYLPARAPRPAIMAGDVLVSVRPDGLRARVTEPEPDTDTGTEAAPGSAIAVLRVAPGELDPYFLAGMLRVAAAAQLAQSTGTGRPDIGRARLPVLPMEQQRRYGVAFRQLDQLSTQAREASRTAAELTRLLADGLATGILQPPGATP